MTDAVDSVVAAVVCGLANALILTWILLRMWPRERTFLARVYLTTLGLRAALAVVLNLSMGSPGAAATFWGDSATYDIEGDLLARRWHGENTNSVGTQALSGYGFVYYVAGLYFVFGRNQLLVQLLNATIGSLTVVAIFEIGHRLFGSAVARWAAILMAFFPQMLFWSAGMYKDPAVLLCIAVAMLAVQRLRESFSPGMALLLGGSAVALLALRFYIFYFVAFAALAAFVVGMRGKLGPRLLSYALVFLAFAGAFSIAVKQETLDVQRAFMTLEQMQVTRVDQATWGQSAYGTQYDVSTPAGALQALPLGLVYLLFAPFPWAISGVRQLLTLPDTLVWYALMPAFVRGLVHAARRRLRDVLPILVFASTLTIAYALMQGNVGTAYRQRTQVTMFFFVFMAVGIEQRRARARDFALTAGVATNGTVTDRDFVYDLGVGEIEDASAAGKSPAVGASRDVPPRVQQADHEGTKSVLVHPERSR